VQPTSNSHLKETLFAGSLGSLLLLLLSWSAFKYFFFAEAFERLRVYEQHGRHLWQAAFSRIDGMFFRPGFFFASIGWHFILPADPMVYHIRNFVFCVLNIFLLHRVLLKFVRSRPARTIALGIFAASKIHFTIIGYINIYESSVLLMTILLSVLFWFRYIETRRKWDYILTLLVCTFSVYSKDNGFVVIGILAAMIPGLAIEPVDVKRQLLYWVPRFVPFVIVSASFLVLRYVLTGPINPDNPIYSPRLSFPVTIAQTIRFLATVGNFTVINPSSMGERGLSFVFNSRVLEFGLVAVLWSIIVYTLWRARSSWRRLLVPLVWIGLYLAPLFLIRNHQVYYFQEPLAGLVLLLGISLERASRSLLVTWSVIVVLIAANGFVSNKRSRYDWQKWADRAETVKSFVASQKSNPPKSIILVTPPQQRDFWVFGVGGPLIPQLLGSPDTRVEIVDSASVGYDDVSQTIDRPAAKGTIFFDLDKRTLILPRQTQSRGQSSAKDATIVADPNPMRVCDGSGLGTTTISYTLAGQDLIEVHVDSPDGPLFVRQSNDATTATGKWVTNGMVFYLQDVSDGKGLTAENTLATVKVGLTTAGCR